MYRGRKMTSVEQSVKGQFAKVFLSKDWKLFRAIAEINLSEAAYLKKSSFKGVDEELRLLIRNIRKRLLIGIGVELLLKAVYLKFGQSINKPLDAKSGLSLPFPLKAATQIQLNPNETFMLSQLIEQLEKVVQLPNPELVLKGLRIAKVFRNKEGHVVTRSHEYEPSSYREIEAALVELYAQAFSERLTVRFSLGVGEKGAWRIAR